MTRFARAKGSKASNIKSPEDSTPWEVMKEQLLKSKKNNEESKNREEAEKQRIENYDKFLKEQRTQKRKATWCEFEEAGPSKNGNMHSKVKDNTISKKKKVHGKQNTESISVEDNVQNIDNDNDDVGDQIFEKKNKKIKKNKESIKFNNQEVVLDKQDEQMAKTNIKKKNKKKKKKQMTELETIKSESVKPIEKKETKIVENNETEGRTDKKKNKKSNKKPLPALTTNGTTNENNETTNDNDNKSNVDKTAPKTRKNKKGDKKARRKPINDRSFHLIINGKEVQLIRFDGFPIMKKDAERLEELKKNMINKGIPKSEVQRTMKLERRRAEKALARLKRDVCYNCRKGGHNLSDCPDLKSKVPGVDTTEGICFKCGSTEHRQFECKVQRDKEFRFATCFICKESGHIARQCPDNPKGLYPNGGCCKLCGDVTHLRKDCPTIKEKKEETSIKLHTLTDDNIEDIGQQHKPPSESVPKKPKKIKF